MIGKKDIELLRLKTRLAECKQVLETSPYASQQTVAKNTLDNLQEQYKEITGEYAADYLMVVENNEESFPTSANRIYNILSGGTFEEWWKKDFMDHIEGTDNAKSREDILADLKNMFK